jgi:N-acetylglucosamine malate deacetylase 2
VFAHPDDETVGVGGTLAHLGAVSFVCVTDGAPRDPTDALRAGCNSREDYARLRRRELCAVIREVGADPDDILFLAIADQQASLHLVAIAWAIDAEIERLQPKTVITHPYEGGHPDHDATAFAVHAAIAMRRSRGAPAPAIVEMTSYHSRGGEFVFGDFLPNTGPDAVTVTLDAPARERKRRLLRCHVSQAYLLESLTLDCERFRDAPDYNFAQPPHEGELLYESFPWGMTGERWRRLAGKALDQLALPRLNANAAKRNREPAGDSPLTTLLSARGACTDVGGILAERECAMEASANT